jgi:predicted acylesterase/phospholipase RssA/protein-S-isoprenylcysteine O-methyltransferase Ste14
MRTRILQQCLPMLFALLFCAHAPGQQLAAQASPLKFSCEERHLQVALGLPASDREQFTGAPRANSNDNNTQVCAAISWGNAYELLSWLENGGIQAAVLPDFAIHVLKADDPAKFERDYLQFPVEALSGIPQVARYLALEQSDGAALAPRDALQRFYTELSNPPAGGASAAAQRPVVELPDHLSGAMPVLIASAGQWAKDKNLKGRELDAFFAALIGSIRFQFSSPCGPDTAAPRTLRIREAARPGAMSKPPDWLANLPVNSIVVRRQVLLSENETLNELIKKAHSPAAASNPATGLFLETPARERELGPALAAFRDANYRGYQVGQSSRRYFRFTLPELWALLDQHRAVPGGGTRNTMALVLTGGGVKAAYQTRMVDYLYGQQCLVNAGTPRPPNAQQVDFVVGTSGGALLGSFVASMDQDATQRLVDAARNPRGAAESTQGPAERTLTAAVWKLPNPGISSSDVFPLLDMLRYASVVVSFLLIALIASIMLGWSPEKYPDATQLDRSGTSRWGRHAQAVALSAPWILLLASAPFVIIHVAGGSSMEHVPPVAGVFYMVMATITVYSELRLTRHAQFRWREARMSRSALVSALAGLLLVVLASAQWQPLQSFAVFGADRSGYVVLACVGFLLLTWALHVFFRHQTQSFRPENGKALLQAFALVLAIPALGYLGLMLVAIMELASLLELTLGFWGWFAVFVLVLSIVMMWLGRVRPGAQERNWFQRAVGFLFAEFRSRAIWGSQRRYMRFTRIAVISWMWWNLLAAPSLYGNENAIDYFKSAFSVYGGKPVTELDKEEFPLAVPFVIAATSLEKGQERYFLFGAEKKLNAALSTSAWLTVTRDPRWVLVRNVKAEELRSTAFASGSPFPVFSAHSVKIDALGITERLIDGGFAHNTPLQAAAALDAGRALVISSSPLATRTGTSTCAARVVVGVGDLTCNLPKLVPYLWERSQVEDVLSTRNMFVAAIYPTAKGTRWPGLTDFRARVVRDLVAAADRDRSDRIGVVESWSAPRIERVQLLDYNLDKVKETLTRARETGEPQQ